MAPSSLATGEIFIQAEMGVASAPNITFEEAAAKRAFLASIYLRGPPPEQSSTFGGLPRLACATTLQRACHFTDKPT